MYYKNTLENPLAVSSLRLHASSAYKAVGMGAQSLVRLLNSTCLRRQPKKQKKKTRIELPGGPVLTPESTY